MSDELTARQREIIERALELLVEIGARGFTMKRLAKKIGVTEAALYRHFETKNDIMLAIVRDFDERARNDLAKALPSGWRGVEAFITARVEQVAQRPALARALFTEELFVESRECAELMTNMFKRHRERMLEAFQEAKESGEIRDDISNDLLFTMVFGAVRQLVKEWARSKGAFSLDRKRDELLKAFRQTLDVKE